MRLHTLCVLCACVCVSGSLCLSVNEFVYVSVYVSVSAFVCCTRARAEGGRVCVWGGARVCMRVVSMHVCLYVWVGWCCGRLVCTFARLLCVRVFLCPPGIYAVRALYVAGFEFGEFRC